MPAKGEGAHDLMHPGAWTFSQSVSIMEDVVLCEPLRNTEFDTKIAGLRA